MNRFKPGDVIFMDHPNGACFLAEVQGTTRKDPDGKLWLLTVFSLPDSSTAPHVWINPAEDWVKVGAL